MLVSLISPFQDGVEWECSSNPSDFQPRICVICVSGRLADYTVGLSGLAGVAERDNRREVGGCVMEVYRNKTKMHPTVFYSTPNLPH